MRADSNSRTVSEEYKRPSCCQQHRLFRMELTYDRGQEAERTEKTEHAMINGPEPKRIYGCVTESLAVQQTGALSDMLLLHFIKSFWLCLLY